MLFVLIVTDFEKEMSCLIRSSFANADFLKLRSRHLSTEVVTETSVRTHQ